LNGQLTAFFICVKRRFFIYSITSELFAKRAKKFGHKNKITQKILFCGLSILCAFFLVPARPAYVILEESF